MSLVETQKVAGLGSDHGPAKLSASSAGARAYLHKVVHAIVHEWPQAELRELLPDRMLVARPELYVGDPDALLRTVVRGCLTLSNHLGGCPRLLAVPPLARPTGHAAHLR
jgi:hypothetical protein